MIKQFDFANVSNLEIENHIESLEKEIHDLMWNKSTSWQNYLEISKDTRNELRHYYTEKYMRATPIFRGFSDLDKKCLMKFKEFENACKNGFFTSNDGSGYYATEDKVTDIPVSPDNIYDGLDYRKDFEYVCWYNK